MLNATLAAVALLTFHEPPQEPEPMPKRICLEVTDELAAALDDATPPRGRNAAIESWLWKTPAVRQAAARLKLERRARRKPGRPAAD